MIVNSNYVSGHFLSLIMDINLNDSEKLFCIFKSLIILITNYAD